jgi:uncharacterized protein YjiS (DUF1127 family)
MEVPSELCSEHETLRQRAMRVLALWRSRIRWRRELARLDGAAMKDMGLTADFVRREAAKMFWME